MIIILIMAPKSVDIEMIPRIKLNIFNNKSENAVTGKSAPCALFSDGINYSRLTTKKTAMQVMLAVTVVHGVAFWWLFNQSTSTPVRPPVLSFIMTMTDLSSSPNSLAPTARSAGVPTEKTDSTKADRPVINEAKSVSPSAKIKKTAQVPHKAALKTTAQDIDHHSQAQTSHGSQAQPSAPAPITPAQFDAAYLQNPAPTYPPLSRRMGEQGNILLSVYVNEQGIAETVNIKQSSDFDRLDNAAIEAVKRWRFIAAKQQNQPIASWVQVPIKFVLE